jgi:hypothetical protein
VEQTAVSPSRRTDGAHGERWGGNRSVRLETFAAGALEELADLFIANRTNAAEPGCLVPVREGTGRPSLGRIVVWAAEVTVRTCTSLRGSHSEWQQRE